MKAVVVYFSLNGHTKAVAESVATTLGAELLRLEPRRAYPKSTALQMVVGGYEATFGRTRRLKPFRFGKNKYELVVLATPVWAGRIAPSVKRFLKEHRLGEIPVGLVVSCAGGKTDKAFDMLRARAHSVVAELEVVDSDANVPGKTKMDIDVFCRRLKAKNAV